MKKDVIRKVKNRTTNNRKNKTTGTRLCKRFYRAR